ncbi:ABC transporter ATP-binding protein [Polaromonas sp.]|uniref:ABC transporter ATP-binding protein n=1 Tax=Polaromonas sp. TaxID=1869339 RepID=UPI003568E37C
MSGLLVQGLHKSFGGLRVTNNVSLALAPGARVALIGPNGAGKTTLVNLISGVLAPGSGSISLDGQDIGAWPQERRVKAGLVRTFQITTLAARLPVLRQVEMALHVREGLAHRWWRSVDALPAVREEACAILDDLGLSHAAPRTPLELAYGEQRLVEMALALALRPRVLLLDEPMAGVPRSESDTLLRALDRLPPELAVLIIEHDMDVVFRFAQHIIVMAEGAVLAAGTPAEIRQHSAVRDAYLGHKP